jgi:hypothetical protein
MAYITGFLVVLTLAGQPVANALCITWCDLQSETQSCGEVIAETTAGQPTVTAPGVSDETHDSNAWLPSEDVMRCARMSVCV